MKSQQKSEILEIMEELDGILGDNTVPRNVRLKIKCAHQMLCGLETSFTAVDIDKSLQELDDISDDPNIPVYAKTQIWNVVSLLEKCNRL